MAHCQFNRGAGLRIMKITHSIDYLLNDQIAKHREAGAKTSHPNDRGITKIKRRRSIIREKKIADILKGARRNLPSMLRSGKENSGFRDYLARLFEIHEMTRRAPISAKLRRQRSYIGPSILIPPDTEESVFVIQTESGKKHALTYNTRVIVLAITLSRTSWKNRRGMFEAKLQVFSATYYTMYGTTFEPCRFYRSKFIDDALIALSNPESTINFLVEKFGEGKVPTY